MSSLYNDNEKLKKMKADGRERVINYFSADAIYSFQNKFYKDLIRKFEIRIEQRP